MQHVKKERLLYTTQTIFNTKTIRSIQILIEGKDKPYLLLKIKVCLLHVFESNKTN